MRPLLNDYRALVIDEAHKLPDAARQMYGKSLSTEDFHELCTLLIKEKHTLAAQRLKEKFDALVQAMCRGELLEDAQRTAFVLTPEREAAFGLVSLSSGSFRNSWPCIFPSGSFTGWERRNRFSASFSPEIANTFSTSNTIGAEPPICALPAGRCRNFYPRRCDEIHTRYFDFRHPHGRRQLRQDPAAYGAVRKPATGRFRRGFAFQL